MSFNDKDRLILSINEIKVTIGHTLKFLSSFEDQVERLASKSEVTLKLMTALFEGFDDTLSSNLYELMKSDLDIEKDCLKKKDKDNVMDKDKEKKSSIRKALVQFISDVDTKSFVQFNNTAIGELKTKREALEALAAIDGNY